LITSIFLPLTPPLALISSTAIPYAFLNLSPNGASGPVMGWGAPILSVSCATAGAAAAARSIPDTRARTRNRRMANASLHGDWVMGLADSRIAVEALSSALPWRIICEGRQVSERLRGKQYSRSRGARMRHHSRRQLLQGSLALAAFSLLPGCERSGEQAAKVPRIGFLAVGTREGRAFLIEGFLQGLREHGYVEGQNIVIEYRFSEGGIE